MDKKKKKKLSVLQNNLDLDFTIIWIFKLRSHSSAEWVKANVILILEQQFAL